MAGTHAGVSTTLKAWYGRGPMRTPPAAGMAALGLVALGRVTLALVGLGMAGVLGCGSRGDARSQSGDASIELTDCGVGVAELECGALEVEENREAPNGRTLQLAIVVARSTSRSPEADPVFLLAGGPGQGAAALAPMILHKFEAIRRDRDLVFVDVRGTGSSAALACDVEDPEDLAQVLGASFDLDGLDECLAAYDPARDLRQYASVAMADDLDDVRAALGYEQVNLLAISYGTALAQVWMRRHGEHIRSAVLDGAVPLDREILLQMPANSERALARVLADCREDHGCDASFPGLERKLAQVLDDLDSNRKLEEFAHPRSGERTRVDITRAGFVQVINAALYSGYTSTLLPLLIERAYAGDYAPVAAMALRNAGLSKTISMGLYLSVACAEQLHAVTDSSRRAAVSGLEVFDDHALAQLEQACARWPHAELPPAEFEPVTSEVPTLLLSGRYDPVTPAELGDHLTASLANARHVTVESASHGIWHLGCAPKLIADFFGEPEPAAVDATCFDTLARARVFLTPNGPLPAPTSEPRLEHPAGTELAQGELLERN
jgi:pimeloyl-ACP methyl ester carboxylesterase